METLNLIRAIVSTSVVVGSWAMFAILWKSGRAHLLAIQALIRGGWVRCLTCSHRCQALTTTCSNGVIRYLNSATGWAFSAVCRKGGIRANAQRRSARSQYLLGR